MTTRTIFAAVTGALLFAIVACGGQSPSATPGGLAVQETSDAETFDLSAWVDEHDEEARDLPGGVAGRTADGVRELVVMAGGDLPPIIVNVTFEEEGIWPSQISVPEDRQVQLVLRNNTDDEHHYHILGMATAGMLWREKADGTLSDVSGVSEEDHNAHHPDVNMVPFHICTSRSGICPTGEWVHAHADPADMDVVIFVAPTPGSYTVTDPLNPDLEATFNVFSTGEDEDEIVTFATLATAKAISSGEQLFGAKGCVLCHGSEAEGGSGPGLPGHSIRQVVTQVRTPVGDMPAFDQGRVSDRELADIATFVENLAGYDGHEH